MSNGSTAHGIGRLREGEGGTLFNSSDLTIFVLLASKITSRSSDSPIAPE